MSTSLRPSVERSWIEVVPDENPDTSYLEQDVFADRFEAFKRGDFAFVGVRACAEIRYSTPQGGWQNGPTVKSPGLWGIEDDSEESYLRETGEEECREERMSSVKYPSVGCKRGFFVDSDSFQVPRGRVVLFYGFARDGVPDRTMSAMIVGVADSVEELREAHPEGFTS